MFRCALFSALDFKYLINYSYTFVKTCTYFLLRCILCGKKHFVCTLPNSVIIQNIIIVHILLLFPVRFVRFYFTLYPAYGATFVHRYVCKLYFVRERLARLCLSVFVHHTYTYNHRL